MNVIVIQFRICMYVVMKIKTRSGSRPTVHFMRDRMLKFYFILYDILINRRRTYQRSPLDCQVRCPVKPKTQNQNDTNYLAYLQSVKISKTKHIQVNICRLYPATIKKIWKVCMIFDSKQNVADIFYTKQIFSFKNENKFSIFFFLASFRVEPLAESVFYNIQFCFRFQKRNCVGLLQDWASVLFKRMHRSCVLFRSL